MRNLTRRAAAAAAMLGLLGDLPGDELSDACCWACSGGVSISPNKSTQSVTRWRLGLCNGNPFLTSTAYLMQCYLHVCMHRATTTKSIQQPFTISVATLVAGRRPVL
jgi:hypothetical protein